MPLKTPVATSAVLALLLSACASVDRREAPIADWEMPPVRSEVDVDAAMPLSAGGDEALFRSSLRAGDAGDWLDYGARYALVPGDILRSMRTGGESLRSAPTEFGGHSLTQQLTAALPTPLSAPVRLDFESGQASLLTGDGRRRSHSTAAGLQWRPGTLGLDLRWSLPRENVAGPLDCTFDGNLSLPADFLDAAGAPLLDVSGRQCRVIAPGRVAAGWSMESWGAAWRWGERTGNALRLRRVATRRPAGFASSDVGADYELGLSHSRLVGGWQARAELGLRRIGEPFVGDGGGDVDTRWTADVALRRRLDDLSVTARWAHAKDPLWFVPVAAPIGSERLSLGLDFDRWLTAVWPRAAEAAMGVSWEWTQVAAGDAGGDSRVNWNLSLTW